MERSVASDVDFEWLQETVRAAGKIALRYFRDVTTMRKADLTIVTEADHEVEVFLREALLRPFPADSLLGEEMGMREGRSGRVWVLDPIDGTAAYATGLPVWGISVGLMHGWQPIAGVFYLPLLDEIYVSRGNDALFNGQAIRVDDSGELDSESFFCITSAAHRRYRIEFMGKTRSMGSTAAHVCYVARGSAVAALLGYPSLWDIAGVLPLLRAAGGDIRCLSGDPLDLAALADGRKCPTPLLAGAPWALDYFCKHVQAVDKR
jgi:myo-inositol-1(or 4)-monophosphatase